MKKQILYSIGQLAQMCNASVKQIRYLEEKGILVPEVRNKDNNYRYYSPNQLPQLILIKTLRDLGFPFEEIVEILSGTQEEFLSHISRQLEVTDEAIKSAIFRYEMVCSYYTNLLKSFAMNQYIEEHKENALSDNIATTYIPKQTVVTMRNKSPITSQYLFIDRFFDLQKLCARKRVASYANMMAVFHDGYLSQFAQDGVETNDLETMVPVNRECSLDSDTRLFGGFHGVSALHKGSYRDLQAVYQKIDLWAKENGKVLMKQSLEIYLLGPDMTLDESEYITRLVVPFEGSVL